MQRTAKQAAIRIRVTADERARLTALAERKGWTVSELVRRAVRHLRGGADVFRA